MSQGKSDQKSMVKDIIENAVSTSDESENDSTICTY